MSRVHEISRRVGIDPRAVVGLGVIVVGLMLWVLAFTGTLSTVFASPTHTVRADFASAEDISPNDPVRIDGVQVGSVASVKMDPGGKGATVTMDVDTSHPIYKNASANILWRTLLGANDAISINPGTSAAGSLGASAIAKSQDSNQVELDQVTQVFGGDAGSGIQTSLQQLGIAFSDHPAVAGDLSTLAKISPAAKTGIGALRGEIKDTDLRNLVRNAGEAAQALSVGTNGSETKQFVESAATTLSALGDDPNDLQQGIEQLDRVYVTGDAHVFRQYTRLLAQVDPVVKKLSDSVDALAPTLVDLKPTLKNTSTLLSKAKPLLNKLDPAVNSVAEASQAGVPVISNLKPALEDIDNTILPGLVAKSPEEGGRSAYEEIGPVIESLGGIASFFNPDGDFMNLTAGLFNGNTQQFLPCSTDFTGNDLLVCSSLSDSLQQLVSGGLGFLKNAAAKPGGEALYGNLVKTEESLQGKMSSNESALTSSAPAVAKLLFTGSKK